MTQQLAHMARDQQEKNKNFERGVAHNIACRRVILPLKNVRQG